MVRSGRDARARRWRRTAILAGALAVGSGLVPAGVSAAEDADRTAALTLTREGNHLLDEGKATEALAKFQEAHRLVGGDKLRYNLGQALRAIPGREADAYTEFERFLVRVPGAAPDLIKAATAERAALRSRIGLVQVQATPAGAAITVDGQARGHAPLAEDVALTPGKHEIRVEHTGHRAAAASLSVRAGERLLQTFALQPDAGGSGAPPPAISLTPTTASATAPATSAVLPASAGAVAVAGAAPAAPASDEGLGSPPLFKRWWFWAAVAGVAALTVGAVVLARDGDTVTFVCPSGVNRCEPLP